MKAKGWGKRIVVCTVLGLLVPLAILAGVRRGGDLPTPKRASAVKAAELLPIGQTQVAIYNDDEYGPGEYFDGGDSNAWEILQTILDSDPQGRFATTVVTDLSAETLAGFDVLVLPDNAIPEQFIEDVSAWFGPCKAIVCLDSAVSYAEYSGFFWPGYGGDTGDVGYGTLWDYDTCWDDGQIAAENYITNGYSLGEIIPTIGGDAEYYPEMLPPDAVVFLVSAGCANGGYDVAASDKPVRNAAAPLPKRAVTAENGVLSSLVYGVYRDIPGHGRMVLLGPYDRPDEEYALDAWPMIRNACTIPYVHTFFDDSEMSQVCLKACGSFTWNVLGGYGAPMSYTGTLNVYNGGTMFWSQPGAAQYVYVYYDPNNHRAWGYLYDYATGIYSSLFDMNTLDDPQGCIDFGQVF